MGKKPGKILGSLVLLSLSEGELPGQTEVETDEGSGCCGISAHRLGCNHHTLPAANVISLENHTEWVLNKSSSAELQTGVTTMFQALTAFYF